jgi:hypothetical protein
MFLHKKGARQPDALNPDNWAIDAYAFSIAASRIFMSGLFMNLTTNIQHYPEWTIYLKDRQPKTLIVWGRNDPLILPAAAEFLKQVVPAADLRYFDASHFALDENADAIAEAIIETFSRWGRGAMRPAAPFASDDDPHTKPDRGLSATRREPWCRTVLSGTGKFWKSAVSPARMRDGRASRHTPNCSQTDSTAAGSKGEVCKGSDNVDLFVGPKDRQQILMQPLHPARSVHKSEPFPTPIPALRRFTQASEPQSDGRPRVVNRYKPRNRTQEPGLRPTNPSPRNR